MDAQSCRSRSQGARGPPGANCFSSTTLQPSFALSRYSRALRRFRKRGRYSKCRDEGRGGAAGRRMNRGSVMHLAVRAHRGREGATWCEIAHLHPRPSSPALHSTGMPGTWTCRRVQRWIGGGSRAPGVDCFSPSTQPAGSSPFHPVSSEIWKHLVPLCHLGTFFAWEKALLAGEYSLCPCICPQHIPEVHKERSYITLAHLPLTR